MGRGNIVIILIIILVSLFTIPVFAQDIGFYSNKLYDFSYNIPMSWLYVENFPMPDGSTVQVVTFPKEFDPLKSIFASPNIMVKFESVPESKIPILNPKEIEKYEQEYIQTNLPSARIISHDVKSTSWGWESSMEVVVSLNVPLVVKGEFHEVDKIFYYKNRESYTVSYLSPIEYYDRYYPVYENMIDTLVIKGVKVPEFQEIVLVVLGSSIVMGIIFARKFTKSTII